MAKEPVVVDDLRQASPGKNAMAGGGVGGILIWASNTFIPAGNFKTLVAYLIPVISILVTWISAEIYRRARGYYSVKGAQDNILKLKELLTEVERDQDATPAHKKNVRAQYEHAQDALSKYYAKSSKI